MRVALVSSGLRAAPPAAHGAVEQQIAWQARGLAQLGVAVDVLTVGEAQAEDGGGPGGARYHRLGPAAGDGAEGGAGALLAEARFARRARALLARLAPDVVHWHARYACLAALLAADGADPWRNVYHAHNWKGAERMPYHPWSARRHAARLGGLVENAIARRADHLVAVSEFVRRALVCDARVAEERVSVVTNALDPARFRPAAAPAAAGEEVLFVGRLAAEKGLDVLIAAVGQLLRARPSAALAVVGPAAGGTERGAYARRCERLVRRLGLDGRVRFAGGVPNPELPELMRRCRVLAVPSVWGEPCGVVVLEGQASGATVVASRAGGIPELIEHGVTGLLCAPGDPGALAAALERALGDEALRKSCAEHGPRRVAERHAPGAIAAGLLALYERLLATRRPAGGARQ
jgi:glycosyltransferase involved in cell wall biosynthesis